MTPDLALTLSYQGISLLTRVQGGWHLLGEVSLESDDLTAKLAELREMATALGGVGFQTMLVLPNDQIKYLDLPAGEMSESRRRMQTEEVLESATPYRADQLMFDVSLQGDTPQVAAVARETLAEAEAFATEHDFNPVCFTAIPPAGSFAGAPDFGLTDAAQRAGLQLVADRSAIEVVGSGPLPVAEAPVPESAAPESLPEDIEVEAEPELPETAPEEPVIEAPAEVAVEAPAEVEVSAPDDVATDQDTDESASASATTPETPAGFASVRAHRDAPDAAPKRALGGATRDVTGTNAPSIPVPRDSDATAIRFDPAKAVAGLTADRGEEDAPDLMRDADSGGDTSTFASARNKTKVAGPAPKTPRNDPKPRRNKKQASKPANADQQNLTMFGARRGEVGGKPRHLGLILTTLLLVFMGLVALWASLFLENGIAGLIGREQAVEVATAPSSESGETEETPVLAEDATDADALPAAEEVIAITVPDGLTPDGTNGSQTALLEPLPPEDLAPEELAESVEDGGEAATIVAQAPALTPEEAEARYAVTGIWQLAPEPLAELTEDSSDTIYVASIDRLTFGLDAVALPGVDALTTDEVLPTQVNPLAASVAFDVDARGLVVATREGALNAEGVMVYAGRPPVVPAAYPKRIIVADALRLQSDARLASVRPKLRPSDLLEQNERATFGGLSRAELASIRPQLRPESAQDVGVADRAPTQYAVTASLRPRQKPANIAQLAARAAQNEAETATPVAAAPPAATVVPTIPSTASVARQATINNAINLRKTSLIGVYGTSSNRRALVRLPSGRYKKVQVGDRIDGGKVAAIGEDELRYVKSGRNLVLKMPKDG
ncbi:hypothetical protein J7400_05625 [Shimia sp. R9_2]|uniref:hypothetical protein n=1 Tax=Shimia sp. R9_2 TaxID=2821112 RepID=UPI001ADA04F0|nr:hypothetical protein [Shimia sp. R9_2]MBO9396148.1 hypothetical protein [Shimia sp. R9_2]